MDPSHNLQPPYEGKKDSVFLSLCRLLRLFLNWHQTQLVSNLPCSFGQLLKPLELIHSASVKHRFYMICGK